MAGKIQCSYGQIGNVANTFSNEAGQTETMMNQLTSIVDNLRNGGWTGRGAEAFFTEMEDVLTQMKKLVGALETSSSQMKALTDTFSNAENDVSSRFKNSVPRLLNLIR
jgi:WXG100 family type VII secretion target